MTCAGGARHLLGIVALLLTTGACGGGQGDASAGRPDAGASGGGTIAGMFSTKPIQPMVSGIWIGKPDVAQEAGGGPFVFLFSGPVTCADLSVRNRWLDLIPEGVQVLELIIGTTIPGEPVTVSHMAARGSVEVNYASGMQLGEHQASTGTVTLTSYLPGASLEGTVDVTFPFGSAKGTFKALWSPTGLEI